MTNRKALQDAYDCYRDEVAQVSAEYDLGKITTEQYDKMMYNLSSNLRGEISEIRGEE